MSTFVLVHGAGHGAWCWERTQQDLTAHGYRSVAVDLPLPSLEDDAAPGAACLDSLDGPALVGGQSYGGLVTSQAASGRSDVEHLVYVAAVLVAADESVMDLAGAF